jgi:UTP--glucose-1-phosphate uridylyltransferase
VSVPEAVDPATQALLDRYHFEPELFARLQRDVAAGALTAETNYVRGAVEPLPAEDVGKLPAPGEAGFDDALEAGTEALRRGEVAAAVLNGGMATRFGGTVKGIVPAFDGRSFLEWKLLDAERAGVPFVVMNSFATDAATREFVVERGLREPLHFSQSVLLRLNPDGTVFETDGGAPSPYSPGHGDFAVWLSRSGALEQLRRRGVRLLALSNVDNLGARVDPVVLGSHLLAGRPLTLEVVRKEPGDVGGAPARVAGRPMLVEGFRFPPRFDQDRIGVFGTNSFVFDLDALDRTYPLTWLYVEKDVGGRPAVQLERLVNEVSAFVPTTYLEVPRTGPRGRFLPIKTPADLRSAQEQLPAMLGASLLSSQS